MATGIITIIASILSLVAGYFFKDWLAKLSQKYQDYKNQKQIDEDKLRFEELAKNSQQDNEALKKWINEQENP